MGKDECEESRFKFQELYIVDMKYDISHTWGCLQVTYGLDDGGWCS